MATDINELRLERIEAKLDKLGEAFVIMARVEEKIITLNQARIDGNLRYDSKIAELESKIDSISTKQVEQDKATAENTRVTSYIKWIIGVIATAIVGSLSLRFL